MSKKFQLSIPTPCHENWDNMSPVEKGRFCDSCQKQVLDFSRMNDREIAMFFKKPSTGSVCGRFMEDQLDRDIEIPKKRIPWIKYFFQFALPAFLISAKAKAQGEVKTTVGDSTVLLCRFKGVEYKSKTPHITLGFTTMLKEIVNGRVVDENNLGVPNATIKILSTGVTVAADSSGKFQLNIKLSEIKPLLEVSSVGYESKIVECSINNIQTPDSLMVTLDRKAIKMDEVVLSTSYITTRKGMVMGTTSIRTTVYKQIKDFFLPSKNLFKIYPNPTKPGTLLNIEWKQSETGEYMLQIFNQAGQLAFNKEMWIDDEARVLNLEVPHVAAGNYFLRMTSKSSGKAFTEKIIIQ